MDRYQPHVIRHSDAASPHYSVRFLAEGGESVTVEFHQPLADGGREPERETILGAAMAIVTRLASESSAGPATEPMQDAPPAETTASRAVGLSRPIDETEAQTHESEGRDTGTA